MANLAIADETKVAMDMLEEVQLSLEAVSYAVALLLSDHLRDSCIK